MHVKNRNYMDVVIISPTCRIYASVNWVNIGSYSGLPPGRRQAILWANAGILLTGQLGVNFNEILIEIRAFSLKQMLLECRLWNGEHFVQGGWVNDKGPNKHIRESR